MDTEPAESASAIVSTSNYAPSAGLSGKRDDRIRRRSYADITAKPCFAHAADYSSVTGELQYIHSRNQWRVRYASVDEDDKYGGGLTLVNAGPMTEYHDGMLVKVDGQIADADAKEGTYRVRSIQVLPAN
jgi:hypothetical protein